MYPHMSAGAHGGQKRALNPRAGVLDNYEVGSREQVFTSSGGVVHGLSPRAIS